MIGSPEVDKVVTMIERHRADRVLVAIDGMSAAGKSTLASAVMTAIPGSVVVSGDDFYRVMDDDIRFGLPPDQAVDEDFDWQRLRDDVLIPLREGRRAEYRVYDWATGELGTWKHTPPAKVVIVEGVYVSRPQLRHLFDLVIWVEAPSRIRAARQATRDDPPEWVDRWERAERHYVKTHRPAENADLIIR